MSDLTKGEAAAGCAGLCLVLAPVWIAAGFMVLAAVLLKWVLQ